METNFSLHIRNLMSKLHRSVSSDQVKQWNVSQGSVCMCPKPRPLPHTCYVGAQRLLTDSFRHFSYFLHPEACIVPQTRLWICPCALLNTSRCCPSIDITSLNNPRLNKYAETATSDLYLGGSRFESRQHQRLFRVSNIFLQVNTRTVGPILTQAITTSWSIPSESHVGLLPLHST